MTDLGYTPEDLRTLADQIAALEQQNRELRKALRWIATHPKSGHTQTALAMSQRARQALAEGEGE